MTKRVCELKRGELFIFMNCEFKVSRIKDGRVYYVPYNYASKSLVNSFGSKSQQRVEIIKTFREAERRKSKMQ